MTTFSDIEFKHHPNIPGGYVSETLISGGLTLSVVNGPGLYNTEGTHEIALFDTDGEFVPLGVYDDVIGHQPPEEINELIAEIERAPEDFLRKKREAREEFFSQDVSTGNYD